jgi:hypothetical protein
MNSPSPASTPSTPKKNAGANSHPWRPRALSLKLGLIALPVFVLALAPACSGANSSGFGNGDSEGGVVGPGFGGGSGSGGGGGGFGGTSGGVNFGNDGSVDSPFDTGVTTTITVYAHSDTQLYTMNPMTNAVTLIGTFTGMGGSTYDSTVTDLAVNAEGEVYVNTESVVYKAAVPTTAGNVNLTRVASIAAASSVSFYALGFAPRGFLGAGETLVGGDSNGELWSIDTTTGASHDLGNFGPVPGGSGNHFALSGDVFFYTDSTGKPTGLATIRSCPPPSSKGYCNSYNDYLAGVDMAAMQAAFSSGTPASSLLAGIYGGGSTSTGAGTGYGEIFGLAAWKGNVYGFARATSSGSRPPYFLSIDTSSGKASVISSTFPFSSGGWSGAGVTSTSIVMVPPPPPAPK